MLILCRIKNQPFSNIALKRDRASHNVHYHDTTKAIQGLSLAEKRQQ